MGVREGLIFDREGVMFEQKPEEVSQVDMGKPAPDRRDSVFQGSKEREVCCTFDQEQGGVWH